MADYRAVAVQAAKQNGVDPRVFVAQINQESGFNPNARSGAGAVGIAQIVPRWHPGVDATNPVASLNYAAHWMGQLVKQYGNYQQALSVYNSGNPNAYKDPGFANGQTFNYVRTILNHKTAAPPPSMPSMPSPIAGAAVPGLPPLSAPSNPLLAGLQGVGRQLGMTQIKWPSMPASPTFSPTPLPFTGAPLQRQTLPAPKGGAIARTALTQIGIPYQWGGQAKLGGRTDCSGLLQASAAANGVHIGRTTYEQWTQGAAVPLNKLRPGDAVFFNMGRRGPEHVAIYIGNGRVVEDPHTGASVEISGVAGRHPVGARRY